MTDSTDRDRQQRELTEELRHEADLRAASKRREEEYQHDEAQTEERTAPADQRQASCDQTLSAKEVHTWARDVAEQTDSNDVVDASPGARR
jgi:hypothetical protein